MDRIGIIGLGRMGRAMAQRLSGRNIPVTVWTRSGISAADAASWGVTPATSLAELTTASDTIVLSLLDDTAVGEVLDTLLAQSDLEGRLIIDTSTVAPHVLQSRIGALHATGASAVDAPVSGGPEMVLAGTCGVFIGGADQDVARAEAALSPLSSRIFPVGPLGAGLVMKTINNSMIQIYTDGLRQLLPLAKRAGLSLETTLTILGGGPAGQPFIRDRLPKILGHDADVGFVMSAALKDNDVFQRILADYGLLSGALAAAAKSQTAAIAADFADKDPVAFIAHAYHSA